MCSYAFASSLCACVHMCVHLCVYQLISCVMCSQVLLLQGTWLVSCFFFSGGGDTAQAPAHDPVANQLLYGCQVPKLPLDHRRIFSASLYMANKFKQEVPWHLQQFVVVHMHLHVPVRFCVQLCVFRCVVALYFHIPCTFRVPCWYHVFPFQEEKTKHERQHTIQSPNSFFMYINCPGCLQITTTASRQAHNHGQQHLHSWYPDLHSNLCVLIFICIKFVCVCL